MIYQFEISRTKHGDRTSRLQRIRWETADESATVASALTGMNADPDLRDENGEAVGHIFWECSCLQKKCGACAMRINGVPRLACDTPLSSLGKKPIRLEPLKKFPVVADLMTDRQVMFDNLREMKIWLDRECGSTEDRDGVAFEASRCLQCGCCLEVCPNFLPGGSFTGTAACVPASRIIAEMESPAQTELGRLYRKRIYEGCGKSLSCRNICPAGIDIDKLLVHSNAAAVWNKSVHSPGKMLH